MFTEKEIQYLNEQRLARIATASATGQVDVAPVGYDFDGEVFYVGGLHNPATYKYRNVQAGNQQVAFVVDDLASVDPWRPRGIKIHGRAEIVQRAEGYAGPGPYLRVEPQRKWSWGVEQPVSY